MQKNSLPEAGYKRNIVILIYALFGIFAAFIAFGILKNLLLPFVIAWMLVLLIQPIAKLLCKGSTASVKTVSVIILSSVLILVSLFAVYIVNRLYIEIRGLAEYLIGNTDSIIGSIFGFAEKIRDKLHIEEGENREYIYSMLTDAVKDTVGKISSRVTSSAAKLFSNLPSFIFSLFMFVFASYYLCTDFDGINSYIASILPSKIAKKAGGFKNKIISSGAKIARAYTILFVLTFAELFLAFSLLKLEYSLTLAFVIATLDILPAIGVGTVLIPWALFQLIIGNTKMFIYLLVIYAVISIVRHIAEPHILGSQLGLHPLAALIAVYAGFRTAGILGLLVAPFAAVGVKKILSYIVKNNRYSE